MNKDLKVTRSYLKGIATKEDLTGIIDSIVLSTRDREIIESLYIKKESVDLVADKLSYSSVTIKRVSRDFLIRVASIIDR